MRQVPTGGVVDGFQRQERVGVVLVDQLEQLLAAPPGQDELDPAALFCGPGADDLALVAAGTVPSGLWLTRHTFLITGSATGKDRAVAGGAGSAKVPVLTAAAVDLGGCFGGGSSSSSSSSSSSGAGGGTSSSSGSGGTSTGSGTGNTGNTGAGNNGSGNSGNYGGDSNGGYETDSYWKMLFIDGFRLALARGTTSRIIENAVQMLNQLQFDRSA